MGHPVYDPVLQLIVMKNLGSIAFNLHNSDFGYFRCKPSIPNLISFLFLTDEKQDEANEQNEQNITVRVVDGKAFLENLSFPSLQVLRRPISRSSPESIDGRISAANKYVFMNLFNIIE